MCLSIGTHTTQVHTSHTHTHTPTSTVGRALWFKWSWSSFSHGKCRLPLHPSGCSPGVLLPSLFPAWLSVFLVCQYHNLPMEEGIGGYTETVPTKCQKTTEPECVQSSLFPELTSYLLVCWLQKICLVIGYELQQCNGRKMKTINCPCL